MKTAQDIISKIKDLPETERQKVFEYMVATQNGSFQDVDGSPVSEDCILEEAKLCKEGVDTEEHSTVDDFIKTHDLDQ